MAEQLKGYWIVTANIVDPDGFAPYREAAGPIIAEHGGRAIVRGTTDPVAAQGVYDRCVGQ